MFIVFNFNLSTAAIHDTPIYNYITVVMETDYRMSLSKSPGGGGGGVGYVYHNSIHIILYIVHMGVDFILYAS